MTRKTYLVSLCALVLAGFAGASAAQSATDIETMKKKLADVMRQQQTEKTNLENFDDLDFNVYSKQKWDLLGKSHAKDIVVHYPDGSTTKGLDPHIAALKPLFVFAPDHKILDHPIRIASGNWTAVMGTMIGTFTQPMAIGEGKVVAPTGKAFKLSMVTMGRWEGATMAEEWLFWDNAAFMKQIGVGQ
ncbi:polyketide cyclase [Pelomonas sp. HMWF004]|nr:polyketide cyclase [Pelomonas sp. HMWF004]